MSKKKVKIFSFVRCSPNSMIASVRIANFISSELGVPIVTDETVAEEPLDVLVIVNGAYAFSKHLADLGKAIRGAHDVVWVQNDYTIIPPRTEGDAQSPFRRAFVERELAGMRPTMFWSTCEKWAKLPGSTYVNWNCLTFDPSVVAKRRKAGGDLFYYGSFRHAGGRMSRKIYFDRYFGSPRVPVSISSPDKKFKDYEKPGVIVTGKIEGNFHAELGSHGAGLYIEDRKSHEEFHSPANRFYEMLCSGLPMIFQPECGSMLRRAGYDPSPWVASTPVEVKRALDQCERWGKEQRERCVPRAHSERTNLTDQVKALYRKIGR